MTITIQATYRQGVLTPKQPLELADGAEVQVTISSLPEDADPLDEVIGIFADVATSLGLIEAPRKRVAG